MLPHQKAIHILALDRFGTRQLQQAIKLNGQKVSSTSKGVDLENVPLLIVTAQSLQYLTSQGDTADHRAIKALLHQRLAQNRKTLLIGAAAAAALQHIALPHQQCEGMGLIPGTLRPVPHQGKAGEKLLRPFVGWARPQIERSSRLLPHPESYFFNNPWVPDLGQTWSDWTIASLSHGIEFPVALSNGALSAVFFYPQLSGQSGLRLLARWCSAVTLH